MSDKKYLRTLATVTGVALLLGIPYLFGTWLLIVSWLPALIAFVLIDEI